MLGDLVVAASFDHLTWSVDYVTCTILRVGTIDVRPESIHSAAQKVDGSGQDWGDSVNKLSTDMDSAGVVYGNDELGVALAEMYEIIGPTALKYFTETGFCMVETAAAMNEMATEYTVVEQGNTRLMRRIQDIVESLGEA